MGNMRGISSNVENLMTVLKKTMNTTYYVGKVKTLLKKTKKTRFQQELQDLRSGSTLCLDFGFFGFFQ